MERITTEKIARQIMGENIIGFKELTPFLDKLAIQIPQTDIIVEYCKDELESVKDSHLLVLGCNVSIRQMRTVFGCNHNISQPCFYNQDWYLTQSFMDYQLSPKWFLIQKNVIEESRAQRPESIIERGLKFPSALQCCYTFFAYYFAKQTKLWEYDFVWCCDKDHNGDQIYVGKYTDIDGVNKSGFSIHRHLALRPCYGAIEVL